MAGYDDLDLLIEHHVKKRTTDYYKRQEKKQKSDYDRGTVEAVEYFDRYKRNQDIVTALSEAGQQLNIYQNKSNRSEYENGFLKGIKNFLEGQREESYVRGTFKRESMKIDVFGSYRMATDDFQVVDNEAAGLPPSVGQLPDQEMISANKGNKKVTIEWTEEDDKLIYSAVKKYTRDFTSLPGGHTREDVLQEAAQAWAKRLKDKGGHDPAKGKKSTLLYRVVQNNIQDLIKAANTDKRKVTQHTAEFEDIYSEWGRVKTNPASFDNTAEAYQGGESKKNIGKGDFEPTKRNVKDSIRYRREQETDQSGDNEKE